MSIKSDKWIKKMASESNMISPFTEDQVRKTKGGSKIISYGVSSYGYDVRVLMNLKSLRIFIPQLWTLNLLMIRVL